MTGYPVLKLADRSVAARLPAFIMGIVNVTPDSFWEKSRCIIGGVSSAVNTALNQVEAGADIIDIGGESSRPGAAYVNEQDEMDRVIPVVEALRRRSDCIISVDTRKKNVMKAAFEAGADMLNDISALEDGILMGTYAAEQGFPVILMHKRGIPAIMQKDTAYGDVFAEVDSYLRGRVDFAVSCGIAADKIVIDPGIGFGKDMKGNAELIRRCGELCCGKFPVLMALSRKTCIGEMTGRDTAGRLAGTVAANMLAVLGGARLLRVHDVGETADMLKILRGIRYGGI